MNDWTDEQKELRKNLAEYFERLSDGHIDDEAAGEFPREKWDLIREAGVIKLPFGRTHDGPARPDDPSNAPSEPDDDSADPAASKPDKQ